MNAQFEAAVAAGDPRDYQALCRDLIPRLRKTLQIPAKVLG